MQIQFFFLEQWSTIIYLPLQLGDLHEFVEKMLLISDICTGGTIDVWMHVGFFSSFEQLGPYPSSNRT